MDVRVRMGDAIDPFQLANGFEAVIGYECQERSNPPFSHSYDTYNTFKVLQSKWVSGKARLGWGAGHRENVYAASRDCVVILVLGVGDLVPWRHSVRASRGPLSVLLKKRISTSYARAHAHTRPRAYACGRRRESNCQKEQILLQGKKIVFSRQG